MRASQVSYYLKPWIYFLHSTFDSVICFNFDDYKLLRHAIANIIVVVSSHICVKNMRNAPLDFEGAKTMFRGWHYQRREICEKMKQRAVSIHLTAIIYHIFPAPKLEERTPQGWGSLYWGVSLLSDSWRKTILIVDIGSKRTKDSKLLWLCQYNAEPWPWTKSHCSLRPI